jgi:hypothetical protein
MVSTVSMIRMLSAGKCAARVVLHHRSVRRHRWRLEAVVTATTAPAVKGGGLVEMFEQHAPATEPGLGIEHHALQAFLVVLGTALVSVGQRLQGEGTRAASTRVPRRQVRARLVAARRASRSTDKHTASRVDPNSGSRSLNALAGNGSDAASSRSSTCCKSAALGYRRAMKNC